MRAEELATEFGVAGVLNFVNTQHGIVKAAISLDGVGRALPTGGAGDRLAASGRAAGPLYQPEERIRARAGDPRRHPDHIPVVRPESARAHSDTARVRAHRDVEIDWRAASRLLV